jgi:hypothetical protein
MNDIPIAKARRQARKAPYDPAPLNRKLFGALRRFG